MIHSFSFKNFCSFRKKAVLDFTVTKQTPDSDLLEKSKSDPKARINKINWFAGPNASGKTSLFKAFAFFSYFVSESFYDKDEGIPVDPFKFSNEKIPIEFELVFEFKGDLYKYLLQLTETQVFLEELYKRKDTNFYSYLFKRSWDDKEKKSVVVSQDIGLNDKAITEILKKNVSVLSASRAFQNDFLNGVQDYFNKFVTNVTRAGRTSFIEESFEVIERVGDVYQKDVDLFKDVKKFLSSVDLGISDIELKPVPLMKEGGSTKKKGASVVPYAIHKVAGEKYDLHFIYESSGTKNLFVLMEKIFRVLRNGGIAIIDEFEVLLHPHILPKIVDLFINQETNPKGSQLIFSTHSLEMFNHLEKEQTFLIEKNNDTLESEVYRLDQIQGIRRDDNLYAKYMAGKFGAIPNI